MTNGVSVLNFTKGIGDGTSEAVVAGLVGDGDEAVDFFAVGDADLDFVGVCLGWWLVYCCCCCGCECASWFAYDDISRAVAVNNTNRARIRDTDAAYAVTHNRSILFV